MPLSDRKRRYSKAIVNWVSIGSPPKRCKAGTGKFFEFSTKEKSLKELKKHGMTNIDMSIEADEHQDLPDPRLFFGFDKLVSTITDQVRESLLHEKGSRMAQHAASFYRKSYDKIVIRRLFSDWADTPDGKVAVKKATKALKAEFHNQAMSDFISENKHVLHRLQHAKNFGDKKAEQDFSMKLEKVKEIAGAYLGPSLPGDGYIRILSAITHANEAVHKDFDETELEDIQSEALFMCSSPDESEWINFFAGNLRKHINFKK